MIKFIAILGGHGKSWYGSTDPGAVYTDAKGKKLTEREINVAVGKELTAKLKKEYPKLYIQSIGVETDASISSKQKFLSQCIKQNGLNPDECLAIHLHCNSVGNDIAKGVEIYTDYPALHSLSDSILARFASWLNTLNRGTKKASGTRAGYISSDKCPSILFEMGFISNSDDRKYLKKPKNVAESIVFCLKKFIK